MAFAYGFKTRANKIALGVREKVGLSPVDRFEPHVLCRYFDIDLIPMTSLSCDFSSLAGNDNHVFSAMLVSAGLKLAIVHNDTHHEFRQRSNICHELAHGLLGHKTSVLVHDGQRVHNRQIEEEADFLAGALLMPNEAALYVLSSGLKSRAQSIYGISKPMLDYRLRMSGAQKIYERRLNKLR